MRRGRLKVVSDGHFDNTKVWVVPEDGGEPIFLPVSELVVRGEAGGAFEVDLRAYACEIDLAELTVFGDRRLRAITNGGPMMPATYPNLEMTPASNWTRAVRWSVSYLKPLAEIFTRELPAELRS